MAAHVTASDTTDETQELLDAEDLASETLKEIKRKSVSGAASYFVRTAILQAIGLLAAVVLSVYFTPEDFGIYGIVTQIIGILIFFSDVGLAATLIQKKTEPSLTDYRTAFTVQQILSWLIVGICLAIIATGVVAQKTGPIGNWILLSLAISFPLASLKTISSIILERKLEFSKVVVPQILEQLVFQGILIVLAIKGFGALAYAYAIVARSLIGVISMWLIQPWQIGLTWNNQAFKSLVGFGAKFQLNDLLGRIKDNLFYLVLGLFLPLNQFGYINWAKQWSMYPYNLTVQNVMAITFPTFSRLQGHPEALRKAIEKTLYFITLVIFPMIAGMCIFIYPLTVVVPDFQKWQPAVFSFVLFAISIGWAAISTPLTNTLNAIGQINLTLKLMIMWTSLTWLLTPPLTFLWFGFNGVAIASAVIAVTSVVPILYVKKFVPIKVWPQIWRQLLSTAVMVGVGVVGLSFWQRSLTNLILGMILVAGVYGVMLLLTGFTKLKLELLSLRK